MLNVIIALLAGSLIGTLARWFYPGPVPLGWLMTALLGMAGSLVASLVVGATTPAGWRPGINEGGWNRAGCFASILGAMALIFLARHLGLHG
jgi:uncharacterized membrane protein YeaQ/YmgE (transglycosylase-associated protein family)